MINKFFLIGGGLAVAGTGTGLGIYYGTQKDTQDKDKKTKNPEEVMTLGESRESSVGVNIPKNGRTDEAPLPTLNPKQP